MVRIDFGQFDEIFTQREHEGGFVFAGVGKFGRFHSVTFGCGACGGHLPPAREGDGGGIGPVVGGDEVGQGLGGRSEVAAVSIEEKEAAEAVVEQAAREMLNRAGVGFRRQAERAGKIHVVVGSPQPKRGESDQAIGAQFFYPGGDSLHLDGVDKDGQMPSVLFAGTEGDHDGDVAVEAINFGRGEFLPKHKFFR